MLFAIKAATWICAGLLASVIFGLIYRFGPNRQQAQWQWLTVGSVTATLFWLIVTLGVSFYVSTFGNYNETYGSLGAAIVLMLWLWIACTVVLVGGEINSETERQIQMENGIPLEDDSAKDDKD